MSADWMTFIGRRRTAPDAALSAGPVREQPQFVLGSKSTGTGDEPAPAFARATAGMLHPGPQRAFFARWGRNRAAPFAATRAGTRRIRQNKS
jgi:hypothetical protein